VPVTNPRQWTAPREIGALTAVLTALDGTKTLVDIVLTEVGGLTTFGLARRADADRNLVLALLRELEAAGRICRTGERRGTRRYAITDEERSQERAAELAAQTVATS
jgi:hypothetical protein